MKPISRRTILKSAVAAVALPWLEAMDANLRKLNIEYDGKRDSGRLLPPALCIVKPGEFDRYRRRAQLQESPEWQAYAKQMRPLVRHIENKILIPTDFSPIGGTTSAKS